MDTILLAFLCYLAVLIVIGLLASRLTRTLADFVLAGRRLGAWVTAISAKASDMSGWLLIGLPSESYQNGFSVVWASIGCIAGTFFNWTALAKRLRRYSELLNALTLPDYFEARFHDERGHHLRLISMVIIVVFFTAYVSAQFVAAGKALQATFGITFFWGTVIGAAVIVFYTVLGGFFAVAWTDMFQGILMVFGLVVLPLVGLFKMGGIRELVSSLGEVGPGMLRVTGSGHGFGAAAAVVLGGLAIGLGYPGQPHIVVRYMAIRKPRELRRSALISVIWVVLAVYGALFIGLVGVKYVAGDITDPDQVMPLLARALLPPWLAGILISAAIAAMMSTADSQLLVVTSSISEDLYHRLLKRRADERTLVMVSRVATLAVGGVAFVLAQLGGAVFWLVLYAWGGLAASFGPPLILSLRWKRTTKWGALAGMVLGSATIVVWHNVPVLKSLIYELFPGFFVSLLAVWVVSLLTARPTHEMEEEFEWAKRALPSELGVQ